MAPQLAHVLFVKLVSALLDGQPPGGIMISLFPRVFIGELDDVIAELGADDRAHLADPEPEPGLIIGRVELVPAQESQIAAHQGRGPLGETLGELGEADLPGPYIFLVDHLDPVARGFLGGGAGAPGQLDEDMAGAELRVPVVKAPGLPLVDLDLFRAPAELPVEEGMKQDRVHLLANRRITVQALAPGFLYA